jgi:hypothetical protein
VCDLSNCFRYVYDEGAISGGVRFATILVTAARALAFRVIRLRTRTLRPGSLTDVTRQDSLISGEVKYSPVSAGARIQQGSLKEVTDQ